MTICGSKRRRHSFKGLWNPTLAMSFSVGGFGATGQGLCIDSHPSLRLSWEWDSSKCLCRQQTWHRKRQAGNKEGSRLGTLVWLVWDGNTCEYLEILKNIVLGRRGYNVWCLEMPVCGTMGEMRSSRFWCYRCQAGLQHLGYIYITPQSVPLQESLAKWLTLGTGLPPPKLWIAVVSRSNFPLLLLIVWSRAQSKAIRAVREATLQLNVTESKKHNLLFKYGYFESGRGPSLFIRLEKRTIIKLTLSQWGNHKRQPPF